MKVAIVGSRNSKGLTAARIAEEIPPECDGLISGGARGVDTLARQAAKLLGMPIWEIYPQYQLYGRTAPLIRNQQIIQNADLVLAFWDHSSRGTKHAIYLALKMEKELRVIDLD